MEEAISGYMSLLQNRELPVAELLARLAKLLQQDFSCQRATIFLRDRDEQFLSALAQGLEGMDVDVKAGEGLVGKAIAAGEALVSNQAAYDVRSLCRIRDHYTGFQTQSLLAAPFFSPNRRPLGAIQLINKLTGGFDSADKERAEKIAAVFSCLNERVPLPIHNCWTAELESSIASPAAEAAGQ